MMWEICLTSAWAKTVTQICVQWRSLTSPKGSSIRETSSTHQRQTSLLRSRWSVSLRNQWSITKSKTCHRAVQLCYSSWVGVCCPSSTLTILGMAALPACNWPAASQWPPIPIRAPQNHAVCLPGAIRMCWEEAETCSPEQSPLHRGPSG